MDSAAATVQRKGGSFPCFIPENRSQEEEALRVALEINPYEKLLGSALSPSDQAIAKYN